MSGVIQIKDRDIGIVLYAFRYCLGRRSYAVGDCVDFLIKNWDKLELNLKQIILKEIEEAKKDGDLGMDIDVDQWQKILEL